MASPSFEESVLARLNAIEKSLNRLQPSLAAAETPIGYWFAKADLIGHAAGASEKALEQAKTDLHQLLMWLCIQHKDTSTRFFINHYTPSNVVAIMQQFKIAMTKPKGETAEARKERAELVVDLLIASGIWGTPQAL